MHRLFVAIKPPPEVRDRLLDAMGGIAGARWQRDDQLHLTLRFIGEVDRHVAQDVAAALSGVHFPAFDLMLGMPGVFDRNGRVDTLWIGVTPHDRVAALHRKIDQALVRVGIAPDTRSFLPHITIARFGRSGGGAATGFVPPPELAGIVFRATVFGLYESVLGRDGSDYHRVDLHRLVEVLSN